MSLSMYFFSYSILIFSNSEELNDVGFNEPIINGSNFSISSKIQSGSDWLKCELFYSKNFQSVSFEFFAREIFGNQSVKRKSQLERERERDSVREIERGSMGLLT